MYCNTNNYQAKNCQSKKLFVACVICVSFVAACVLCVFAPARAHADGAAFKSYSGETRYETSNMQALDAHANGVTGEYVIVVGGAGDGWADALSASPLAGSLNATILLTKPDELMQSTSDTISQIGAKKAIIIGGDAVVGAPVENSLVTLLGLNNVERLWGGNRFATQMEIYKYGKAAKLWDDDTLFVASGATFGDSLSAAPVLYNLKAPLMLVSPETGFDDAQKAAVDALVTRRVVVLGGEQAVSASVYDYLSGKVEESKTIAPKSSEPLNVDSSNVTSDTISSATSNTNRSGGTSSQLGVKTPSSANLKTAANSVSKDSASGSSSDSMSFLYDSTSAASQNKANLGSWIVRLGGATRFETSAEIAKWAVEHEYLTWDSVGLVSGVTAADSLGAGPLQGQTKSILLLVDEPGRATLSLCAENVQNVTYQIRFFGGTNAISQNVRDIVSRMFAQGDVPIVGSTTVSQEQMVKFFNYGNKTYPADVYAQYGAPTIYDFVRIVCEECAAEGINGDVVFAQAMLETGFLKFGGDVQPHQCNFSGLGATGGVPGADFSGYGSDAVRMGFRAQVQHLKCYASYDKPVNEIVDPRWNDRLHGRAISARGLQGTWAASRTYANTLIGLIGRLQAM